MSMTILRAAILSSVLVAGAAVAGPFGGPPQRDGHDAPPMRHGDAASRDSLAESVRRVERSTRGQILSAERVPFDGRDMNRIKVVDATGRVRVITEDPRAPRPTRDRDGDND